MSLFQQLNKRLGPSLFITVATLGLVFLIAPEKFLVFVPLFFLYYLPLLGKDTIIPTAIVLGISPLMIAITIAAADVSIAVFIIKNWDVVLRIPKFGKFLTKFGGKIEAYRIRWPWMREFAFTGLLLLTAVPFRGLGSFEGAIVSKILNMKEWRAINAIAIGSLISATALAYSSKAILPALRKYPMVGAIILFSVFLLGYGIYWHKKHKNKLKKTL